MPYPSGRGAVRSVPGDAWRYGLILTRAIPVIAALVGSGCATDSSLPGLPGTPPRVYALTNPSLVLTTSGTVGPRRVRSALDRGFGEYDSELQSSLFLCAGTGPAAGPCLAVLGGLFALAGATSSLVHGALQGDQGRAATADSEAAFADQPVIAELSARIAAAAAAQAAAAGRTLMLVDAACQDSEDSGASIFELDIVEMKLAFTPGYEFQLTLVARVVERGCRDQHERRQQRLAYLGPVSAMSRAPQRSAQAFAAALAAAVVALGRELDLYLQGKRPRITP